MKPKTIEETVRHIIRRAMNFDQDASSIKYDIDNLATEGVAQIQQLLEECLPEPTTALDGNEAQIFIMATDQYKSNLMERVK